MANIPSYRLYREKTGESGDFWIHCETVPERTRLHNWEIAQHRHDSFFQIFVLSAGHGEMAEPDGVVPLVAPCAIFIPAGAVHGFRYARDIDGLVVTALAERLRPLLAAEPRMAAFLARTRVVPLGGRDPDAVFAVDCVRRLHGELHGRAGGRMALLEPLLTAALVSLVRAGSTASRDGGMLGDRDRRRVETLTTLIAAHFRAHRPVRFYARAIGVSAAHLNRLARRATGFSVQELAALQLMEAARRDLVFTPAPIQSIAYSLGFSDPAYFNRFFRRQAGTTPGAFREAERKKLAV